MANPNKATKQPADQKAAFLTELVEGYSRWIDLGNEEYALAYERMIFAHTQPSEPKKE